MLPSLPRHRFTKKGPSKTADLKTQSTRICTPLLLAGHSVVVAIHLHSRTILQEELRFNTRSHLRTTRSSITAIHTLRDRHDFFCLRRGGSLDGVRVLKRSHGLLDRPGSRSLLIHALWRRHVFYGLRRSWRRQIRLLVGAVNVGTDNNQKDKPNERSERRMTTTHACMSTRRRGWLSSAVHANSLRFAVLAEADLVVQRLANGRARSIRWKRADVHKEVSATMRPRDEAEAAIVIP